MQQKKEKFHKKPPFSPCNYNNKSTKLNGQKPNMCFRCGLEDNFIAKFTKMDILDEKVHKNTKNPKTHA